MAITTASSAAKGMIYSLTNKTDYFNLQVKNIQTFNEPFLIELPFEKFGSSVADVQFIIDAGYKVTKDTDNNKWNVTLIPTIDPLENYDKPILDLNVLPAATAVKLLPSVADRRLALFNQYVSEELTKLDPFPFQIQLSFSMWGNTDDSVKFAKDAGYVVTKNVENETWDITLP